MNKTRIIALASVLALAGAGQASAGGLLGLGIGIKRRHKHVLEREAAGEFDIPRGEDTLEEDFFKAKG